MDFDRSQGIGGSDVPAILGVSPWRDRTDVWMEKTHHPAWRPKPITPEMRWGTLLEPVMRSAYEEDTGRRVYIPGDKTYWADDRIRYAHLDGLVEGEGIWEGKVPFQTFRLWQGEPPVYVLAQVQHYLSIVGEPWCDVSALLPGADFQTFRVPADPAAQESIRLACLDFWDHVISKEPPDPLSAAIEYPRHSSDLMVVADEDDEMTVSMIRTMKAETGRDNEEIERLKEELKQRIGTAAGMMGNGWRIRFKSNKDSVSTDWKLVAGSYRKLIEQIDSAITDQGPDEVLRLLQENPLDTIISLYTETKPGARPFVLEEIE